MDFKNCKPSMPVTLEKMKCNCDGFDETICDEIIGCIRREIEQDRPSSLKIENIRKMIEDNYH